MTKTLLSAILLTLFALPLRSFAHMGVEEYCCVGSSGTSSIGLGQPIAGLPTFVPPLPMLPVGNFMMGGYTAPFWGWAFSLFNIVSSIGLLVLIVIGVIAGVKWLLSQFKAPAKR